MAGGVRGSGMGSGAAAAPRRQQQHQHQHQHQQPSSRSESRGKAAAEVRASPEGGGFLPALREEALTTPRPTTPRTPNRRPLTPAGSRRPFTAAGPRPETATSLDNPLLSHAEREAMGLRVQTARPHGRKVWEPKETIAMVAYGRAWPEGAVSTWGRKFVPTAGGRRTGKWAAAGDMPGAAAAGHASALGGGGRDGGSAAGKGWKEELASQVRTAMRKGGSERKWWHEGWATPVAPEQFTEFTHRTSHVPAAGPSGAGEWGGEDLGHGGWGEGGSDTRSRRGMDDGLMRDHVPSVDLGFDPPEGELPIVLDDFDDDNDDLEMESISWGRDAQ